MPLLVTSSPALALDPARTAGYGLQQAMNGVTVAAAYCLLAVAYALLHGITGRIVLSFGEIAAFGAFAVAYSAILFAYQNLSLLLALPLTFLAGAAAAIGLGHVIQRQVFAPLMPSPGQAVMIASIGVSIAIQEILRIETRARDQWLPPVFSTPVIEGAFGGFSVTMTGMQLLITAIAAFLLGGLLLVISQTRAGRLWRGCSQNRSLCELSGIDTQRVMAWSAAAAAFFASASGWIVAVGYGGVSFYMGLVLGLKALFASIIGGFGTIGGAILGGLVLAAIETAWSAYFPIIYRDAVVFLVIIAILVLRPGGLLGVEMRRDSEVLA
jgi:branched-chain amino acid transport system permease protein